VESRGEGGSPWAGVQLGRGERGILREGVVLPVERVRRSSVGWEPIRRGRAVSRRAYLDDPELIKFEAERMLDLEESSFLLDASFRSKSLRRSSPLRV
jgi:hypothetical protein